MTYSTIQVGDRVRSIRHPLLGIGTIRAIRKPDCDTSHKLMVVVEWDKFKEEFRKCWINAPYSLVSPMWLSIVNNKQSTIINRIEEFINRTNKRTHDILD